MKCSGKEYSMWKGISGRWVHGKNKDWATESKTGMHRTKAWGIVGRVKDFAFILEAMAMEWRDKLVILYLFYPTPRLITHLGSLSDGFCL